VFRKSALPPTSCPKILTGAHLLEVNLSGADLSRPDLSGRRGSRELERHEVDPVAAPRAEQPPRGPHGRAKLLEKVARRFGALCAPSARRRRRVATSTPRVSAAPGSSNAISIRLLAAEDLVDVLRQHDENPEPPRLHHKRITVDRRFVRRKVKHERPDRQRRARRRAQMPFGLHLREDLLNGGDRETPDAESWGMAVQARQGNQLVMFVQFRL
jgi:hypothetical protein